MNIHLTISLRDWQLPGWNIISERERERERESRVKLKVLLSYWYYKDVDLETLFEKYFPGNYPEIFADSGAYSAMTQGGEVVLKDYVNWIKRWQHLFITYANLDVIKNAEKTWENQQRIEDMGLQPLPAFHILEDWKWLEMYVDRYSYIGIGGLADKQNQKDSVFRFLIKCFRMANGKSVFHGFACTSWQVMKSFRWYSVDSSSWGAGFRYGQVPVFDCRKGCFLEGRLGNRVDWRKLSDIVIDYGFDPVDFADRNRNDRAKICALSALSYIRAEQWLRKFHGEVFIPRGDDCAVLHSHLSDANPQRFIDAVTGEAGVRLHLSDTGGIGENYAKANAGIKSYLSDSKGNNGRDLASVVTGIKIHLAEHSLDRGGVGDTSRAMEILCFPKNIE